MRCAPLKPKKSSDSTSAKEQPMSPATEPRDSLREQANQLYWNSSETVDQVAARLGMSRKAVYGSVEPLDAGATCTSCGSGLVYGNRTNRAAAMADCPACGIQMHLEGVESVGGVGGVGGVDAVDGVEGTNPIAATPATLVAESADSGVHAVPSPDAQSRWGQIKDDLVAVPPERAAKIGGAAALGVALGAAAVKALKKRG
jgi:hypothetical protein